MLPGPIIFSNIFLLPKRVSVDFGLLGKRDTVSSLVSTIQTAGTETGLQSIESRILSLVISTRLCLNQQLAVVVVKPKFYFKQIPRMLRVTAVSS